MKLEVDFTEKFKEEISKAVREVLTEILKPELFTKQKEQEEELLSIEQACNFLGCTKTTLFNYRKNGSVPYYQRGRKLFFKKSDLLRKVHLKEFSRKNSSASPLTRLNQCKNCTTIKTKKEPLNLINY